MEHDDPNGMRLAPKKTDQIVWRFTQVGVFEYFRLIPGHREAGMIGTSSSSNPRQNLNQTKGKKAQQTRSSNARTLHPRFAGGIRRGRDGEGRGQKDRRWRRKNYADKRPNQEPRYGRRQHDDGVPSPGSRDAEAGEGRGQRAVRSRI